MNIEIIDNFEKLMLYKAEWDRILKEMDRDVLFFEFGWIVNWWNFFGDKHNLFVLIITNDIDVVGICPLMKTNRGVINEISFIGDRESSCNDFIIRDGFRDEAIECVCDFLRYTKGNNIIKFDSIAMQSASNTLLKQYLKDNKVPFVTSSTMNYLIYTENRDFNTYFNSRFGKKSKHTMRNKEKRLNSLGNLVYKKVSQAEIDEVFEVHEKRWLRKIGNSSFSKGINKEFYKGLALNQNMQFDTTINTININNRVISFIYGFEYCRKCLLIRIAHDDDYYFLSPGELVFKRKIEECFLSGINVIDFGPGYEPYKAKWTDDYEEVINIMFPSGNIQSNLNFLFKYWARIKLINYLKKCKRIYNFRKYSLGKFKYLFSKEAISDRIAKVKGSVNQRGFHTYVMNQFSMLSSKIFQFRIYLICEKELAKVKLPENSLHIKLATIDDVEALSQAMNESSCSIIRRFSNKHKCFITLDNGKIIHYCWIEASSKPFNIQLENCDAYIYDTFMEAKYINEYNYSYIFSNIFNNLCKENYKKCYISLIKYDNSLENNILKKIFHPSYEIYKNKIFKRIKYSVVDLKLNNKT